MGLNVSCIIHCQDVSNLSRAVHSCLAQGEGLEVIVVGDGLADESFAAAEALAAANPGNVRALRNGEKSGVIYSLTHGALHARGSMLCLLDPDDEFLPGYVPACIALLAEHGEVAAVQVLLDLVAEDGARLLPAEDPRLLDALASYPSGLMLRKEVFMALGASLGDAARGSRLAEEYALLGALTRLFRCTRIPAPYVRHPLRSGAEMAAFLARSPGMSTGQQGLARDPREMVAFAEARYAKARDTLASLDQCRLPLAAPQGEHAEGVPTLSFVTVCKGRLHHLKQTLPLLAALPNVEVIVVDYACPQGTADWVAANYPHVRVGRVTDDPGFNLPRARNIGAYAATSPWICFIDADVAITDQLMAWARDNLRPGAFYRPQPVDAEGYGSFFCPKSAFLETGGYDEAIQSWGGEDDDFYARLKQAGYREATYPSALVSLIRHGDEERTRFYEIKDKAISHHLYQWYSIMKYDLTALQGGPLPLEQRRALMSLAADAAKRIQNHPAQDAWELFALDLGERTDTARFVDWKVERTLRYRRSRRAPAGPGGSFVTPAGGEGAAGE